MSGHLTRKIVSSRNPGRFFVEKPSHIQSAKNACSLRKFLFMHGGIIEDFTECRWPFVKTRVYLCYRAYLVVYQTLWVFGQIMMVPEKNRWGWPIYIGNWTSILMLLYFGWIFGVLLVIYYAKRTDIVIKRPDAKLEKMIEAINRSLRTSPAPSGEISVCSAPKMLTVPWYHKVQWGLYNCVCHAVQLNNILTWTVVIMQGDPITTNLVHFPIDVVVVCIDMWMVAMPTRFAHVWQPMFFGLVYLVFVIVFWQTGARNAHGDKFIHKIIDIGGRPESTTLLLIMVFCVLLPSCQVGIVALAYARDFCYEQFYVKREIRRKLERSGAQMQRQKSSHLSNRSN